MEVVKQLAVFLENRPGALSRLTKDFADKGINIQAISVTDSTDHAVVRLIVDKPTEAIHLLGETGVLVVESDLLRVNVENVPGALVKFSEKLSETGVNIEYAYGSCGPEPDSKVSIFCRVMDPAKVLEHLQSS